MVVHKAVDMSRESLGKISNLATLGKVPLLGKRSLGGGACFKAESLSGRGRAGQLVADKEAD